uniref:7TM_GPCR_Srx domain-containing protein n=1 Tax=Panagrellus redivivus TaxID=6233 RepID=A0A7E4W9K5_PANRE
MVIMVLAYARNLDTLIQITNIIYTSSLVIIAVFFDILRKFIAERIFKIFKGIIYFLGFLPIFVYCIAKFHIAAVEFGEEDPTFGFIILIVTGICCYEFYAVVTILQGLWALLWNPKNQNKVSFIAIA